MNEAFGYELDPPFSPYRDPLSYMLGAYMVPYVGLLGYVGANPFLTGYYSKRVRIYRLNSHLVAQLG